MNSKCVCAFINPHIVWSAKLKKKEGREDEFNGADGSITRMTISQEHFFNNNKKKRRKSKWAGPSFGFGSTYHPTENVSNLIK